MYLFIVLGLGTFLWPEILNPNRHWELMQGENSCMLAAFSIMSLIGIRYPLQMLPVLLWEVTWKTMWLILVPLPQLIAGHVDKALDPTIFAISMVVLVYAAIPWGYVHQRYIVARSERWGAVTVPKQSVA
jgi:hypothetical protein